MNERSLLIRHAVLELLQKKQTGTLATQKQVDDLFNCGLFTEQSAIRYIIKSEYSEMIRKSDISHRSLVINLSIKWEISESSINNIIYKYQEKTGVFLKAKK